MKAVRDPLPSQMYTALGAWFDHMIGTFQRAACSALQLQTDKPLFSTRIIYCTLKWLPGESDETLAFEVRTVWFLLELRTTLKLWLPGPACRL